MLFFWRQPRYESELSGLLKTLPANNLSLAHEKQSGFERYWKKEPLDTGKLLRRKNAELPFPATPYP